MNLQGYRQRQRRRRQLGLCVALLALLGLMATSVCVGTQFIAPAQAWQAVIAFDASDNTHLLVRHVRLPRTLVGVLVGLALGMSGVVMQALTRNPLADPGLLGVTAGAALGIVCAVAFLGIVHIEGYLWFGLLGAGLAGGAVYLLGGMHRGVEPVRLVLAGAALSVVLLALTQLVLLNTEESVFDQFRHWAVGSLQGRGGELLWPVAGLTGLGLLLAMALGRMLDSLVLGDELGRALGAHPLLVGSLAALAVTLLAGTATAAAGPISFIGLTAPHLARFITGPDHRWLMPYSMLLAALLLLAADCLGRLVVHPGEVGVGIMVALIGGPFFVVLVRRKRIAQL